MDSKTRRFLYNRCDPSEALGPTDDRRVDLDGPANLRGGIFDRLAREIEMSDRPLSRFVTSAPGAGMTTEIRRVADRLERGAGFLTVIIDGAEVFELQSPLTSADILLAILARTTAATGGAGPSSRRLADLPRGAGLESAATMEALVAAVRASPLIRDRFRNEVASWFSAFLDEVRRVADLMLSNNIVLRYKNSEEWFDLHPALRHAPHIELAVQRVRAERAKAVG